MLLDHAGEVVTREQFRQQLWPSDTFVDFEHSLNTAIKELRGVLSDSATEPRYIQTVPKLGYRFIFSVARPAPDTPPAAGERAILPVPQPLAAVPPRAPILPARRWTWLSLRAAALLLLGIGIGAVRMGVFGQSTSSAASAAPRPRPSIAVLGFKNLSRKPRQDWMSTAMAEMLGAELASGGQIG